MTIIVLEKKSRKREKKLKTRRKMLLLTDEPGVTCISEVVSTTATPGKLRINEVKLAARCLVAPIDGF